MICLIRLSLSIQSNPAEGLFRFSEGEHQKRHPLRQSDLQPARLQLLEGLAKPMQGSPTAWRFQMFVLLVNQQPLLDLSLFDLSLNLKTLHTNAPFHVSPFLHCYSQLWLVKRFKLNSSLFFVFPSKIGQPIDACRKILNRNSCNPKVLAKGKRNKPTHASRLLANCFLFPACFVYNEFFYGLSIIPFFHSRIWFLSVWWIYECK